MEPSNDPKGEPQFDGRKANTDVSSETLRRSPDPAVAQSSTSTSTSLQERDVATPAATNLALKTLPTDPSGSAYPVPATPRHSRRRILIGTLGVGAIAALFFSIRWWQYASTHQETDDAYVTGHIHPVNARISGTVTQVLVDDNQIVAQGALLVQLDPRDYEVALQQAKAALENARHQADVAKANIGVTATNALGQTTQAQGNINAAEANVLSAQAAVTQAEAGIPAAQAQLAQLEANLVKARLDYERYTQLYRDGAVSRDTLDAATATYKADLAQRDNLSQQIKQARSKLVQSQKALQNSQSQLAATKGNLQLAEATGKQTGANRQQYQAAIASIDQATAQVKNAQLQLSYTQITAPTAGRVGNKTVEVGQRLQPGQTLMAVVQDQPWILANFKETQLGKMKPGQAVEIKIDSFPQHPFKGKVDSVSPASGAKFALLPPDNATGNFTKIVQRVPVKVVFDPASIQGYEAEITPGMSVIVSVVLP
ncbi:MAG: HlyD family secretion protein [Leptolyngbya sp. BL-A-14]